MCSLQPICAQSALIFASARNFARFYINYYFYIRILTMRQSALSDEEDSNRQTHFNILQLIICRHLKDDNFLRAEHLRSAQMQVYYD